MTKQDFDPDIDTDTDSETAIEKNVVEVLKTKPVMHCDVITWIEDPKDFPNYSRMETEVVDVYREKPM